MTKIWRMREIYIDWTRQGRKHCSTRLTKKDLGEKFELVSGSYYKPKKSGVIVEITSIMMWSQANIGDMMKEIIYKAEGFQSWEEFINVLLEINKKKNITKDTYFHTMTYKVIG